MSDTKSPTNKADNAQLLADLKQVEGGGRWVRRLAVVAVLAAVGGAFFFWRAKSKPPPPPGYITRDLDRGDIRETVESTGTVQPMNEVHVGAQVSGRVKSVFVDFNSKVKKGDVLAEIDPLILGAQVAQVRAQLAAQIATLRRAKANLEALKLRLARLEKLVKEGLANHNDLDLLRGQTAVAKADVAQARANIAATRASLSQTNANLSFAKIIAPIDGVVTNRAVDPGQTVAASFQTPQLFVIAQDLKKMRVFADIDEADVGKLKEGMGATAQVDAFPGEKFSGKVTQVRYNPKAVQGVVTYQAIIEVDNSALKLRPGMTATVAVLTHEAKNVLRVANAALRFRPSPEKGKDGKPKPKKPLKPLKAHEARLWTLLDSTPGAEKLKMHVVKVGITDGLLTELKVEQFKAGSKVVTDESDEKASGGKGKRRRRLF